MSDATVVRLGQADSAGDDRALFLKLFSGEVLTAFDTTNVMVDKQVIRTISSGKSAAFPATWKVIARYHTPGAEIVGQTSNANERIIHIDNLLYSDVFLGKLDAAMAHYDVRAEYSKQCGEALATRWDRNSLQVGVLAARASATVSGGNGGSSLTSATTLYRTSAADLVAGVNAAAQTLDEKDIPETEQKFTYVRPAQWYLLSQYSTLQNQDFSGSAGKMDVAKLPFVGGTSMVKTNNLPITDLTASQTADMKNTYNADFSKTAFLTMTRQAIGTVKLLDLATEIAWDARRRGELIIAEYAVGTGILRPECAVEGKTTT